MKQSLLTSDARQFSFLMLGEESVVRNYKKVNALFEIHFSEYQPRLRYILAQPEFSGDKASEKIRWTTELFETEPVRMSSLGNDEKERYRELLAKELDAIKEVLQGLPSSVAILLQKAVTYHSEDAIYCADDMVVIAEWGMQPKGSTDIHGIALDISGAKGTAREFMETKEPMNEMEEEPAMEIVEETSPTGYEENSTVGYIPPKEEEEPVVEEETPMLEESVNHPVDDTVDIKDSDEEEKEEAKKKKRRWLWFLLLIPLLLLLLLLRRCSTEDTSTPPPPIEDDDLEWADDSLSLIVNNRVILLLSDQYPVEDFVKDFRKKYPSKKKYQLYVPDKILPRVVLTLPADELESISDRLPGEFPKYDLMVVPESIFNGNRTFNDPAFDDALKSWYFDMINVETAWYYSTGSPDVVVAVIDDGFDLNHPELKGKDVVKPYNAVDHTDRVYPNPSSGHGTHVASTAVGMANNGEGSAGIAPGCKLMPIQVADANGFMSTSAIVDGVLYAISQKADVVNMSLGKMINPLVAMVSERYQEEIIRTFFLDEEQMWRKIFGMGMSNGKDMAFVLAGGNSNILIGIDPMQRVEGTIRVSAVMPNTMKAEFSNYGRYSDLSAPGVNIYNAVSGTQQYASMSGTSMASPIVAGGFALMKSIYPGKSVSEITYQLQHTGVPSKSRVGNIIHFGWALEYDERPVESNPITDEPNKDPITGLPVDTDPRTGKPIYKDPITGKPVDTDPRTGKPIYKDPLTDRPVDTDPETGKPIYKDPITGKPVDTDPRTGKPVYKDPVTGKPVDTDPRTGKPVYKDPITGKPVDTDPWTGEPIYKDPITDKPVDTDPRTGKPIYKDPISGDPVDTEPRTGKPIYKDPRTGKPVDTDPRTGKPIYKDPITGKPVDTDPITGKPVDTDPRTGKPIYKDPITGKPVDTDPGTGKPIYKDPVTGKPVDTDPGTGKPIYKNPITGKPVDTDPRTGKPIYKDPITGRPINDDPVINNPDEKDPDPCPDCTEAQRRFDELMRELDKVKRELDKLKRENPDCY